MQSIEDMAKAIESMPEMKKLSGNLTKHTYLSCEINGIVDK